MKLFLLKWLAVFGCIIGVILCLVGAIALADFLGNKFGPLGVTLYVITIISGFIAMIIEVE